MSDSSLPSKDRPEWQELINEKEKYTFISYVLQMKTYQLQKAYKSKSITMQQAIDELYELCSKYILSVQPDLQVIFKQW